MANASYAPVHNIDWDFPLWSEILPGLFLGGTDDDDTSVDKRAEATRGDDDEARREGEAGRRTLVGARVMSHAGASRWRRAECSGR